MSVMEYRAEVVVQGRKSATAKKRPHYSHITPATTFAQQVCFDVGRVKAQMKKAGMDVVEVRYFSRMTTDWKLDRRVDAKGKEMKNG